MSTVRAPGPEPAVVTVPVTVLDSIAHGGGGAALADLIKAQHSKAALLVRAIVELAGHLPEARASDVRHAYHCLLSVADQAPEAVRAVLTHPSVLGWAMSTTGRLHVGRPATPELLGVVAAAAALRGGTGFELVSGGAASDPNGLALPSLGYLVHPGSGGRLDLRIPAGDNRMYLNGSPVALDASRRPIGPAWRPLPHLQVTGQWSVQVDWAHSPLPAPEPLLDAVEARRWRRRLAHGWRLLAADHPEVASDVAAAVRTVAPRPAPRHGHSSGAYRHAFGCLSMSLPTDPRLTALTLAHEVQHMKLSGLMDLFELVQASAELGYAPWRDDPRPLAGLLQGAYAHLGAAAFWRRRAEIETDRDVRQDARIEYVRWREASLEVCADLRPSAALTTLGRRFVDGMRDEMTRWRADPMPRSVVATAERLNDEHRVRFRHTAPRHD